MNRRDKLNAAPWRVGTHGRTVYDADDTLIGVMDTPALAAIVVSGVNYLASVYPEEFDPPVREEYRAGYDAENPKRESSE